MKTESQTQMRCLIDLVSIRRYECALTFYLLSKDKKGQRFVMNYYRQAELKQEYFEQITTVNLKAAPSTYKYNRRSR
jgi:hypothetical protein